MAREKAGVQRDRDRNSSSFAAVARKRRMHPGCCGMEGKMGIQVYNSRFVKICPATSWTGGRRPPFHSNVLFLSSLTTCIAQ